MDNKTSQAIIAIISRNMVSTPDNIGKITANLLLNEVSALFSEHKTNVEEVNNLRPDFRENFSDICFLRASELISTKHAKELILESWNNPSLDLCAFLIKSEILNEADASALIAIIEKIMEDNPKTLEQIKGGKTNVIGFLVGQTMKAVQGKGNPVEIKELIMNSLKEKGIIE